MIDLITVQDAYSKKELEKIEIIRTALSQACGPTRHTRCPFLAEALTTDNNNHPIDQWAQRG